MQPHATRESWLIEAAQHLTPLILEAGGPEFKQPLVSVGLPSGRGGKNQAIGQCWSAACSDDKERSHIFVSPTLDNPTRVLDVLAHELIHSSVGVEHGHKAPFRKVAVALGLEGKMTATVAGPELQAKLEKLAETLGDYPHAKLDPKSGPKKQTTRMLKLECPSCGAVARISRKWAETVTLNCDCGIDGCTPMELA